MQRKDEALKYYKPLFILRLKGSETLLCVRDEKIYNTEKFTISL